MTRKLTTNTLMKYDAFILHSEDTADVEFAFEIKANMEKYGFKV